MSNLVTVRMTRNWFAPTEPVVRDTFFTISGRMLRKDREYELTNEIFDLMPANHGVVVKGSPTKKKTKNKNPSEGVLADFDDARAVDDAVEARLQQITEGMKILEK